MGGRRGRFQGERKAGRLRETKHAGSFARSSVCNTIIGCLGFFVVKKIWCPIAFLKKNFAMKNGEKKMEYTTSVM